MLTSVFRERIDYSPTCVSHIYTCTHMHTRVRAEGQMSEA